jgi:hypothetical protein
MTDPLCARRPAQPLSSIAAPTAVEILNSATFILMNLS